MTEATSQEIIELIESTGLAYIHSSGSAVLKDGTWLSPDQWDLWLEHIGEKGC
ncbi:MAG: hypothetical protein SVX28_11680 [Pseudomonadota bacterium]|nr:hypothetical protein [Pseudomonadota bacterium]